jgi:hypothetical protein
MTRWLALLLMSGCAFAVAVIGNAADVPSFSSYPAQVFVYAKDLAALDLSSHPKARRYRTVLKEGAAKGVNFAGAYAFISWGCGTACAEFAVVNAKTGRVHFSNNVKLNAYHAVTDGTEPFDFRVDSRLLVLTGSPNDGDESGTFYYEWTGDDFLLISKQLRKWLR